PRIYGETAAEDGRKAFEALQGKDFPLEGHAGSGTVSGERSPFGFDLNIRYPQASADELVQRATAAMDSWREAGPKAWVGVSLETMLRLNVRSFEIAQAGQHTPGQGFMMAFQAGGPPAQDRGRAAVAYAWREMYGVREVSDWEKPQGIHEP